MIVGKTQQRELRQHIFAGAFAFFDEILKFVQELICPQLIGKLEIKVWEARIEMSAQLRLSSDVARQNGDIPRPWAEAAMRLS